jgi:trehalose 6-phosphate phosphatase
MTHDDTVFPGLTSEATERIRAALAARQRGLFTDVDGTISAIAPTPADAVLLPKVAELLAQARASFDIVAAVSGRSARDVRRLVGVPGLVYIGNHGLERIEATDAETTDVQVLPDAEPYVDAIDATLDEVADALEPRYPGIIVERKGVSGSIHVRATSNPEEAEEAIARALTAMALPRGLRVTYGKRVVELRPPIEVDKGTSIADLIDAAGLRGALYLGDDATDIDAFRRLRQLTAEGICQGAAIAILHAEAPADLAEEADVALDSIERVPEFLRWILANA